MIRSPLASRRALTHLARLRARPDEDGAGAAIYCVMLLGLVVTTLLADTSHANRVERVALNAQADDGVTLRVLAESPPAFQVFRIPGENTFALELPGSSFRGTKLERPDDHPVLAQVRLDAHQKGTSRVVLRFLADVDYEASAKGRELEVRFRALRDVTALRAAYTERQKSMKPQTAATNATEQQQKEAALHARGLALEKKEESLAQSRRELDQQRRDFEKERDAVLRLQNEEAAKLKEARLASERQEQTLLSAQKSLQEREKAFASMKQASEERQAKAQAVQMRQLEQARVELQDVQRAMTEAKASSEKWRAEVKTLRAEANKLEADMAQEQLKRQEIEAAIVRLQKDITREAESHSRKQRDYETQQEQFQSEKVALEQSLKALRSEKSRESEALEQLKKQREREAQNRADETASQATRNEAAQPELQSQLEVLRAREERQRARYEQEITSQKEQLAEFTNQVEQQRERFSAQQSAWQKREAQLKNQVDRLQTQLAQMNNKSEREPRGQGFGGARAPSRPATIPTTNGRLFEFGQGNRLGGALHHLTVQRQGLFSSRVGLQLQGKIRYSVQRSREREVVLTLYDTYAANLAVRRILDARDLGTNVLRILPRVIESDENKVILTIELRQAAAVSASSESGVLWFQFGQPGS